MQQSIIQQCVDYNQTLIKANPNGWYQDFAKLWSYDKWPSSKEEIWRYAELQWLDEPWQLVQPSQPNDDFKATLAKYDIEDQVFDLVSVNGQFLPRKINGVTYYSNSQHDQLSPNKSSDFFNQLGWLGLSDWSNLVIEDEDKFDGQWHCILDKEQSWQNLKLNIHVKKNAHLRLKINLISPMAVTNLSISIRVEAGGTCELMTWSAPQSRIILDYDVNLDKEATLNYDAMNFESAWCHERNMISVGEAAKTKLVGLLLPSKDQYDHKAIYVKHVKPLGKSLQKFFSVAAENGIAAFHGRAIVCKTAPKTDASQLARALMLSKQCQIFSRPELEIDIDDVQCQHGSSIGELDQEALFYLQSRGIKLKEAKSMLIHGFIEDVVNDTDETYQTWIKNRILKHNMGGKLT
tara:strand:+ start:108 stop:1325 length:1218 start_codon:yes stop_codon:yes gene_type:complete